MRPKHCLSTRWRRAIARWTSAAPSRRCCARNLMKSQMATWSKDELRKIAEADDLHISPFRQDGVTYGTPTWIWSVAVDDALYRSSTPQKCKCLVNGYL